jgi:hypothetical protein
MFRKLVMLQAIVSPGYSKLTLVNGNYSAHGESFIVIGNFKYDSLTNVGPYDINIRPRIFILKMFQTSVMLSMKIFQPIMIEYFQAYLLTK